jgi:hypothetical protein
VQLRNTYSGIYYAFWTPHLEAGRPWSIRLSRAGSIQLGFAGTGVQAVFNVFMHPWEYTMHFGPLVSMLEGPGPWDSRGQAEFTLGPEGRQHSACLHWHLRAGRILLGLTGT